MNSNVRLIRCRLLVLGVAGAVLGIFRSLAFPPAPHHTLFGMVRNEWGDPIQLSRCEVILETPASARLQGSLTMDVEPGVNYRLEVPMDSGATEDAYKPTALRPYYQFKLRVKMGSKTYVPIEMTGDFARLGEPGGETRLDLTLGEDADGDGLPDAWERAQLEGREGGLDSLRPNDDLDGDGISNLNEYLAGTYTADPSDGFSLSLIQVTPESSIMELLAVPGRNYRILASPDLLTWIPVKFRLAVPGEAASLMENFLANEVRMVKVEVPTSPDHVQRYFKALVH
ncbi:MAG: hypothetical protein JNK85_10380 [Verrucomicrobiales bacterium]|nr:hypothetical protein [Verrucomicrobiales bacterium]